ncbi:MAG: hypothetical protein WC004_01665 [Candidatus Absconditabacterales bacterium]
MQLSWKELQSNPVVSLIIYLLIIFFVVFSTKAYVGYLAIEQAIQSNVMRKAQLEEKIAYLENFRLPYLESEYAAYFIPHENGMASPDEQVVKFIKKAELVMPNVTGTPGGLYLPNRSGGWSEYIKYKLKKIDE